MALTLNERLFCASGSKVYGSLRSDSIHGYLIALTMWLPQPPLDTWVVFGSSAPFGIHGYRIASRYPRIPAE